MSPIKDKVLVVVDADENWRTRVKKVCLALDIICWEMINTVDLWQLMRQQLIPHVIIASANSLTQEDLEFFSQNNLDALVSLVVIKDKKMSTKKIMEMIKEIPIKKMNMVQVQEKSKIQLSADITQLNEINCTIEMPCHIVKPLEMDVVIHSLKKLNIDIPRVHVWNTERYNPQNGFRNHCSLVGVKEDTARQIRCLINGNIK